MESYTNKGEYLALEIVDGRMKKENLIDEEALLLARFLR
jgi:hypothetical protein